MHDTTQEKLDLKYDDYCLVSNERLKKYLEIIKHREMRIRETKKTAQVRLKHSPGSNENSHVSNGRILKNARKEVNKTSQGEARL